MELAQYMRIFRAHWIAIMLCTILGGGLAFGWTLIQPRVYSADATGTVSPANASEDAGTSLLFENLAKSKVKSYLQWAKSRSVAEYAIEKLNLDTTPERLVSSISATNPVDTPVIRVVANASSPESARDLATAWLEGLAAEGARQDGNPTSEGRVLELKITESAVLPSAPSSPNTNLALLIGLFLGFAGGVAYAMLKNVLDRRLRTAAQIEQEFALSVIGTIPIEKELAERERLGNASDSTIYDSRTSHSALAEAMRELRTNLQFMNVDNPPKVMVVSSPLPGDGKSTVTANLALTIAASGQRVVVIDADLRRPTVAKTFGLVEGIGLTDVLVGRAELADVLQPWGASGNLLVMGAGKHPPNPSELLNSHAMEKVLASISKYALVLIDAPPLIPVTDAAILAAKTDGVIVVASAGKTTTDAMSKALQNLDRVKVKPLGIILNRVPRRGPNSAHYGYKYNGYYGSDDTEATEPAPAQPAGGARRTRETSSPR